MLHLEFSDDFLQRITRVFRICAGCLQILGNKIPRVFQIFQTLQTVFFPENYKV